jgi:hypothetical protein
LYKVDEAKNFDNILFASGKIANYLWAGLAIVTNIDSPLTREAPFIFLSDFADDALSKKLSLLFDDEVRERYRQSAFRMARQYYDFDRHMSVLFPLAGVADKIQVDYE